MSNELLNKVLEQSQSFVAPVVKANKLAVANLEKLVAFQLNALESYVALGLDRLKAAAEVSDVNSLQAFVNGQVEAASVLRQKLIDDTQALVDLGTGFKAEFDKLAEENVAELNQKVGKAVKKAA